MRKTLYFALIGFSSLAVQLNGQPKLSSAKGWVKDLHTSASIAFGDSIIIEAPNDAHAHIERDISESEPFRVSAAIKSPAGSHLAPSLFLYWNSGNWVRTGYISAHDIYHVNGPGIYGIVCEDGKETQYRLTTTSSEDWTYNHDNGGLDPAPADSRWNRAAVVLGSEMVHFQVGGDGTDWETIRSVPRGPTMQLPPEKLIVGKGYYNADSATNPDLDNDLPDIGTMTKAEIRDLSMVRISEEEINSEARTAEHYVDVYGQRELDREGDPSYDSVASVWPPLQYTRDAIGVANHPDEFTVLPNGIIGCFPNQRVFPQAHEGERTWFVVGQEKLRFGGETTVSRSLQDQWLPILTCGWSNDGLTYEQTLAGWSEGMSEDKPLVGFLRMRILNEKSTSAAAQLAFFSEKQKTNLATWDDLQVAGSGETSVYLKIDFPTPDRPVRVARIEEGEFNERIAEIETAWTRLVGKGMQISVPEAHLMNAWRAWLVWMFIDVDKINGLYEFHDGGGGFYELVYGYSASRGAQLADMLNRKDEARRWLETMLAMGDKDGLFIINFGLPDQGSLFNAVAHHFDCTKDVKWTESVAPTLVKMNAWAKKARAQAKAETATTSPVYGMIKGRPYCDHPEPGYYIISDVLLATGMQNTARILDAIGMKDEASWIAQEAQEYVSDLKDVVERSLFVEDGQELLPLFPETRELLRATGWMASNYYSLLAPTLLESGGEVVPPNSRYAGLILDALENRGGLLMGVSRFWGGIDHAYTGGYWKHHLLFGDPKKALLGLYASMAYGMSRDTFASVEVTFAKDGKNFPTLPHNFSNLEQLRLVRNLLIMDEETTLILGAGISRSWLHDGLHVEVKDAGTRWGNVSYRVDSNSGDGRIRVKLTLPSELPAPVKFVIRHPDSKPAWEYKVTGGKVERSADDFVLLSQVGTDIEIEALY